MRTNIETGELVATTHDKSIMLSPKYIGCLTNPYRRFVFIDETIGVTAKLSLKVPSDNIKIIYPTTLLSGEILPK